MGKYLILALFFFLSSFGHEVKLEGLPKVKVVMFVSEEAHHKTETALVMAKSLLSSGSEVLIVLEGPSVRLADAKETKRSHYRERLKEVVKAGGKVYACPYWGRKMKLKALMEGVEWANPQVVFPALADEKTRVTVAKFNRRRTS